MNELSTLAPFIVAAVLCAAGLFGLHWITHNRPTLVRRVMPETADEEQSRFPFDEPDKEAEPEVRPQFEKQFEKH